MTRLTQITILFLHAIVTTTNLLLLKKDPEPYHTSILTGQGWVEELLSGHPERIRCELGVQRHTFLALIAVLRELGYGSSKHVSLEEQLAIFLYMSVTGLTIRHAGERFQRSNETISLYFRHMLLIISSHPFFTRHVILPIAGTPVSDVIRYSLNNRFWPWFRGAQGALDGSHFHTAPPLKERPNYRNRKGFLSMNCLFACSFNFLFVFAYTGWEGSATDAQVLESALDKGFHIPDGYYYLADAGYAVSDKLLTPYRGGVRYHLAEWRRADQQYVN